MKRVLNTNVLYGWRDSFHKYLPKVAKAVGVKKEQSYIYPTTDEQPFKISTKDLKIIEKEVKKINKGIERENNKIRASDRQKNKKDSVVELRELSKKILIPDVLKAGFEFKNDIQSAQGNFKTIDDFFVDLIKNHKVLIGTPLYDKLRNIETQFQKYFANELNQTQGTIIIDEINKGPKLKKVDPSLIKDRSEAKIVKNDDNAKVFQNEATNKMLEIAAQRNSGESQDFDRDDSEWEEIEAAQPKDTVVKPSAPKPTLNKSLSASNLENKTETKPTLNKSSSTNDLPTDKEGMKKANAFLKQNLKARRQHFDDEDDWGLGDDDTNNSKNTTQEVKKESNKEFKENKSKIQELLGKRRDSFSERVETENKDNKRTTER